MVIPPMQNILGSQLEEEHCGKKPGPLNVLSSIVLLLRLPKILNKYTRVQLPRPSCVTAWANFHLTQANFHWHKLNILGRQTYSSRLDLHPLAETMSHQEMEEKKAATEQNLNLMKTKGFDDLFSCSNKSIYNHREVSCIHQSSILKLFPPNPLLFLLEIFLLMLVPSSGMSLFSSPLSWLIWILPILWDPA